ncbi:UTP-hexose-1-phosphate uridylyltransferase [Virgibacillus subterraneus]|uniref:Galactose-1-phosphate uridylyltransferase n=1 Tax=Virgibacillus subterraneus TaxID=621109 RepID=A0A1H9B1C9_9BACI|nr:UDP-glucose--hexose-1-phosphate uridylyltransferase [Virgibacillus subterraneus]SEP82822.1 UTP-hexose-1-phosphate uridylyltransferase [Virgibacillus subterraneus]
MTSIYQHISNLLDESVKNRLIETADKIYAQNILLDLLQLDSYIEPKASTPNCSVPDIVDDIVSYAVKNNIITDILAEKEKFAAKIMDVFVARPSMINEQFQSKLVNDSSKSATSFFYELSKNSNYIQMKRIKKNVHFKANTEFGSMDITINLSKPEKDPEQLELERSKKEKSNYPLCPLCIENEGYAGRIDHAARANHRVVKIPLQKENWYLQYSPYVYYNEHCILLAEEHRDMKISKNSFERLLEFVETYPHYFMGSNADLPIVGGSILSHDHYQGGNYEFAMTKAKSRFDFSLENYTSVSGSVLYWPISVIRLQSIDKNELIDAANHILNTWKNYTDEDAGIHPFTNNVSHNTITPIARIRDGKYELDLALRNNRTTAEHPMGIFHPHADVHHIKKENIGLIEVMGLAVLPPRLIDELNEIKKHLLGEPSNIADYHQAWAKEIKAAYGEQTDKNMINSIMENELGKKFVNVLEDAGVFKQNSSGENAFKRFIQSLNKRK